MRAHRGVQLSNLYAAEVPSSAFGPSAHNPALLGAAQGHVAALSLLDVTGCRCDLSVTCRRGSRGLTERATLLVAEHPAFARTFAAPDRYSFRQPWLWGLIAKAEMESFSGGEFGVDFVHSDGEALVLLSGELDVATAPALREHLAELASQGLINISVDLSALRFIDSVGLSVFVVAQKHLEHMGGSFLLLRPCPRIQKLLQVTALTPLLLAKPVVVPSIADEAGLRISRTAP